MLIIFSVVSIIEILFAVLIHYLEKNNTSYDHLITTEYNYPFMI